MSFGKLDVESLHGLYEIKGTAEEIGKITTYKQEHPGGDDNIILFIVTIGECSVKISSSDFIS